MKDFLAKVESLTREWGMMIGRSMGERIAAQRAPSPGGPAQPATSTPPPARKTPALLPGLAGRRRKPGEPPPPCGHPGCGRPSRTRGYCQTHYVQWLKSGR